MKKVMIGTPCYDGKVAAHYADAMLNSVILGSKSDMIIRPIYLPHQAVIQYARNELLKLFLSSEFDELVFIDSDQAWKAEDLIKLINSDKDFIGAPVIRKAEQEMYNIKCVENPLEIDSEGLMVVDAVGTGMLKLTRNCIQQVWDMSQEYSMDFQKESHRMAFEIGINDKGQTVSEDNMFCFKWQELGGKVYVDTTIDPYHIGDKVWKGSFANYIERVIEARQKLEDTV
jgi:hypothetical protein